tara:strand:- start:353 stop:526 length:174 start_codon:yes stop_codon:yes gene_type:complete
MMKKMKKHQVKTQWYYWFWGAATVAVVSGQIYIGAGYSQMSKSIDKLTSVFVKVSGL